MKADRHVAQEARLAALRDFDILDTPSEQAFDDIVRLASQICGMPMSVISLVDAHRQWFKAEIGLGTRETSLEESICSHAILTDGYLEIEDTTLDIRTRDNPLVLADPHLRFYAGAVLRTKEGLPIGSLCVLDSKPRRLTEFQQEALRVLAGQVMTQLDLRRALHEADLLRREVDHRVKNSLQSISSLTRLQARRAKSHETREALDIVQRRIDTVAALHEALHKVEAEGGVGLVPFVEKVAGLIRGSAPETVRIATRLDDAVLTADQAASIGVILNEFASNTFKHAFPDGRQGTLTFESHVGEDEVVLTCRDDGVGMSGERRPGSLGLLVIDASAQQMQATQTLTSDDGGTTLTLTFSLGE
ncbi:hypothetical protein ATO6_02430 [Oceanicola sp. 22II-s10i]|uniref:sensor histidine kinase n=1 Tax=Oceanicola sp. 22II-s10i TaxID=1317116 RepID=UPI000B51E687|nr:histidine kinase dimerization/phosphoacceptor domain -containing protein [Oceanicola sp. 22II-s10i]OWU85787.1 hypothetical protein ATO6_02430 [Oceanicola sp. 22II-s10i]